MTLEPRRVLDPVPGQTPPPTVVRTFARPLFCYALIGVCALLFVADPGQGVSSFVPGLREALLLYGPAVQAGEWWRVLTDALVHGGLLHVGFNMWAVTSLGFALERAIGTGKMAFVSLIGALGASAASLYFSGNVRTLGASGMILSWAGVLLPLLNAQGRRSIGIWLVQVAVLSLLPGVSWQAHLGGFLIGLPCGAALRQGPRRFPQLAPFLLFLAAALVVLAAFSKRWGS